MYRIFFFSIVVVTVGCGYDERKGDCYGSRNIRCEIDSANIFYGLYETKLIAEDIPMGECQDHVARSEQDISIPFERFYCRIQGNEDFGTYYDDNGLAVCKGYDETKSITYNHDTNTASYSEGESEPVEFSCDFRTSYYAS